jgi:hypothetical protein
MGVKPTRLELLQVIATLTGDDLSRHPRPRRPLSNDQLVDLLRERRHEPEAEARLSAPEKSGIVVPQGSGC